MRNVKRLLYLVLMLLLPASAMASETIRVAIADNLKTITLYSAQGFTGSSVSSGRRDRTVVYSMRSVGRAPVRMKSMGDFIRVNGKNYRGWIELRKNRNGRILVINELDIEDYLKGVIASEVPNDWDFEVLKAQAVAARTYALYQKRTSGKRPYHILATVSSQVYNGSNGERVNTVRAVQDTKGIFVAYRGEAIPAFYHSSCGGHTEDAAELWGIDEPYLKGVDCECQEIIPNGLWEKRIRLSLMDRTIKKLGYRVDSVSDMRIGAVTRAGRVKEIVVGPASRTTVVPADALRAALGSTVVPSVFFELDVSEGEAVFSGRGSGHGVGLCQWGAKEMAKRGFDYKAILSHYYPGTGLLKMK
jgi:stage II sporulation protein D